MADFSFFAAQQRSLGEVLKEMKEFAAQDDHGDAILERRVVPNASGGFTVPLVQVGKRFRSQD